MISRVPEPEEDLMARAHEVLRERFGFDSFREGQDRVVAAVLEGRDALCILPTGGGKSLCYQLPAVILPGVTLVVSPLIALMTDQVTSLRAKGIAAGAINSHVPAAEQDELLAQVDAGELDLLYVAPERFRSARFRERLAAVGVTRVAVDEAHCISQWGHDFRPDYRRIGGALESFGRPPVLALTATAPPEVQEEIVEELRLRDPLRSVEGLVRDNLLFTVEAVASRGAKEQRLIEVIDRQEPTLVYCATRRSVNSVWETLKGRGLDVRRYHAGLREDQRAEAQSWFLESPTPILAATNAFGMGIDRPDVRHVIHHEIPGTVEAYVQETGRAGRDGVPARVTLLYSAADIHIQRFFLEASNPSRAVIEDVLRVLRELGEGRHELTADELATRLKVEASGPAVGAALAVLDRAAVIHRGRRGEGHARIRVYHAPGDLFEARPLKPGLGRLLEHLIQRFGIDQEGELDVEQLARDRGVTPETIRRGLRRLADLDRIQYTGAFQGRATEVSSAALAEDVLASVDFEALEQKRAHEERKLDQMVAYAHLRTCRVQYLLSCFGVESAKACGRCDTCQRRESLPPPTEGAQRLRGETVRQCLEAVSAFDRRYGFRKLANHLAGSKAKDVVRGPLGRGPTYGALAHLGVQTAEHWLRVAHDLGLLRLVPHRLQGSGRRVHTVALAPAGLRVLKGGPMPEIHA